MRAMVFGLVAVAVTGPGVAAAPPTPTPAEQVVVGVLSKQGTERCTGAMRSEWTDVHWEVGFTPLTLDSSPLAVPHDGEIVRVDGSAASTPKVSPVTHSGPCPPPMQMRSDWVRGMSGIRLRRDAMGPVVPALAAVKVAPWRGLVIARDGDEVVATVANDLGAPVNDMKIVLHYEGCFGKPGTDIAVHPAGTLAPGATVTARFPVFTFHPDQPESRQHYRASSVQITSGAGPVAFDLDRSLGAAGVRIRCPKRRP